MKYPLLVKKHVSFICNFLLTKVQYFFNRQYPEKLSRNPPRDAAFLLKKRNLVTNDTVSLPVPYAACFSIYSHLSNMHNSCQKVFSFQCINAIFLENPVKMNMLRTHGNFPIRQHTTSVGPFAPLFLTWSHPTAGHNAEKNVTPRSQEVTNHLKNTVFRDFSTSSRTCIFFPLTLSLLWSSFFFSFLLFSSLTLPTSAFPSIHIVGSLTSKPPLIISERVLRM